MNKAAKKELSLIKKDNPNYGKVNKKGGINLFVAGARGETGAIGGSGAKGESGSILPIDWGDMYKNTDLERNYKAMRAGTYIAKFNWSIFFFIIIAIFLISLLLLK